MSASVAIGMRAKAYGEAESAKALSILESLPMDHAALAMLLSAAYLSGTVDGMNTILAIRKHELRPMDDDGIAAC